MAMHTSRLQCPAGCDTLSRECCLAGLKICARYRSARIGNDFYNFVEISPTCLLFILLDIAGNIELPLGCPLLPDGRLLAANSVSHTPKKP
jgi:hypothetical protein